MKTAKDRIEAKKLSLKSVSGKLVSTKNGKLQLKRSNILHQSCDYSNQDLSQLFANIKRRYSFKHEPLSPKVWDNRPTAKSFQERFDRLYQNTLLCEQNEFPEQITFQADHCYFYFYMFKLEKIHLPSSTFLFNQKEFSNENRSNLVNWLVQKQCELHLHQETLFLAVMILDRYIKIEQISLKSMHDVAATALMLAHKLEETKILPANKFREKCGLVLNLNRFLELERQMLIKLDFRLYQPTALVFLRRYSEVCGCINRQIHLLAKFMAEKCQLSHECVSWLPSLIAAACLYISGRLVIGSEFTWNTHLQFYSGYSYEQVRYFGVKAAHFIKISDNWSLNAINFKYSTVENLNIANCYDLRKLVLSNDPSSFL